MFLLCLAIEVEKRDAVCASLKLADTLVPYKIYVLEPYAGKCQWNGAAQLRNQ